VSNKQDSTPRSASLRTKLLKIAGQVAIVVAVLFAVTAWQTRHLLSRSTPAPSFELDSLDGERVNLAEHEGRDVVLYFFAPW